jgi:hypothetical protein
MDRRPLLLVVAGVVVVGAIVWFVRQSPAPIDTGAAPTPAAPAASASAPAAPSGNPSSGPARSAASAPTAPPPTRETLLRRMEDRFIADPLAPEWSRRNEKVVADFLAAPNLTGLDLAVPLQQSVECHSSMCRIALLFPDIDAATRVHERMVLTIGESLPMAQTFTTTRDDGRTELITFAGDASLMKR